ncbi:MAG: bifunctional 3-deoxy-7-phosphoheptulonate synthase/chorismate mutase type II [Bacteroidetes bacterium]|nr:bifunctional 3-deoxy-7-phosphoheptulonate synthase/chorismate mutase type II [Bacteroidota bacterium]
MARSNKILFKRRNGGKPLLIAGPCSAESEVQMLETAKGLQSSSVTLFRAGIWKPRTRPGNFEGVGLKGLHWMNEVQNKYGLRVVTEVANTAHVEACLELGIDALWIGARTSANPFSVQEIANAIRGTGIPVLIKNPVNPDIGLWIGAIERILSAGSTDIAVVHRGFSSHTKGKFRNAPLWEIPIEMKRVMPEVPILCDPSHISGNRKYLAEVSQKAMDLSFDGLMIESHIHPEEALSDSEQQLTPKATKSLIKNLVLRKTVTDNVIVNSALKELRNYIDELDDELMQIVSQRMSIVAQIAAYKKENNLSILQEKRWAQILFSRQKRAEELGLSAELFMKIFEQVHQESILIQTGILNEQNTHKTIMSSEKVL